MKIKEVNAISQYLRQVTNDLYFNDDIKIITNSYAMLKFNSNKEYLQVKENLKQFKKVIFNKSSIDLKQVYNMLLDKEYQINNNVFKEKILNNVVVNIDYNDLHLSYQLRINKLLEVFKIASCESSQDFTVNRLFFRELKEVEFIIASSIADYSDVM